MVRRPEQVHVGAPVGEFQGDGEPDGADPDNRRVSGHHPGPATIRAPGVTNERTRTDTVAMLRVILFLGIALVAGAFLLGFVFPVVLGILGFAVKVLVLGALAYLAIRIVSPRTAAQLRERVERSTLPRL